MFTIDRARRVAEVNGWDTLGEADFRYAAELATRRTEHEVIVLMYHWHCDYQGGP